MKDSEKGGNLGFQGENIVKNSAGDRENSLHIVKYH